MSNATRLATAITILTMVLTTQPVAADLTRNENPLSRSVKVVSATPEQQALVDWAVDRYEVAALPLPAVTIEFHDNTAACHDYLGYYDQSTHQLDMCNWGQHYKITPASTLLHELAHAWSFEYLPADVRQEFVAHRNLDTWDANPVWWYNGQEQAAEIIAWGISDGAFTSAVLTEQPCADLSSAFEVLTGAAPIAASPDACKT